MIGVIKGDTRNLDYGSLRLQAFRFFWGAIHRASWPLGFLLGF